MKLNRVSATKYESSPFEEIVVYRTPDPSSNGAEDYTTFQKSNGEVAPDSATWRCRLKDDGEVLAQGVGYTPDDALAAMQINLAAIVNAGCTVAFPASFRDTSTCTLHPNKTDPDRVYQSPDESVVVFKSLGRASGTPYWRCHLLTEDGRLLLECIGHTKEEALNNLKNHLTKIVQLAPSVLTTTLS